MQVQRKKVNVSTQNKSMVENSPTAGDQFISVHHKEIKP